MSAAAAGNVVKMEPKGDQMEPKGFQKRAKWSPTGAKNASNGDQGDIELY